VARVMTLLRRDIHLADAANLDTTELRWIYHRDATFRIILTRGRSNTCVHVASVSFYISSVLISVFLCVHSINIGSFMGHGAPCDRSLKRQTSAWV